MQAGSGSDLRRLVAANIRRRRLELGLTQERLAFDASLHRTYVGSIERAARNVSLDNLEKLALALRVPTWTLLYPGESS